MISLTAYYNKTADNIYTVHALKHQLNVIIGDDNLIKFGRHNAAVWIEILKQLTEFEEHVSKNVVDDIIKEAEEKYGNIPDTEENLTEALHLARFNEKIKMHCRDFFSVFAIYRGTAEKSSGGVMVFSGEFYNE